MKQLASKKRVSKEIKAKKKDNFRRHSVLLDSKRKAVVKALLEKKKSSKKGKVVAKSSSLESIESNPYSKIKNLPHDLQNQLADNICSVYLENEERSKNNSNIAWGAGFVIPTALETAGFVAGFNFDLPSAVIINVIFAAIFRFSVGNSMIHPSKEMAQKKASQAANLLLSGKINSEYAQTRLVNIIDNSQAYSVLSSGNVSSEEAQLQLVDRSSHSFTKQQLNHLLKGSILKGRAKKVISDFVVS